MCIIKWSSGARFLFPFHYKDFFDTDSNFLAKYGSQTKVSQGLVFRRDVHVPGFEWNRGSKEERNAFLFALSPSADFPSFPKK